MANKPKLSKAELRKLKKAEFRKALKAMGTTPHKVAGEIGVSRRQVYRYASGETNIPQAMMILVRMLMTRQRQSVKA